MITEALTRFILAHYLTIIIFILLLGYTVYSMIKFYLTKAKVLKEKARLEAEMVVLEEKYQKETAKLEEEIKKAKDMRVKIKGK